MVNQNQRNLKPWVIGLMVAMTACFIQGNSEGSRGGDPSVFTILGGILFFIWVFVLAISVNRDSKNIKDNDISPTTTSKPATVSKPKKKTPDSEKLREAILFVEHVEKRHARVEFFTSCAVTATTTTLTVLFRAPLVLTLILIVVVWLGIYFPLRSIQDELLKKKLIERYGEDIAGEAYYTVNPPGQSEEDSDE